jgi:hypothetical protein
MRRESVRQPAIPKGIDAAWYREQTPETAVKSRRGTVSRKIDAGLTEPGNPRVRKKHRGGRYLETRWWVRQETRL